MLTNKNEIFNKYITNGKSQTDYERLQFISNNNLIKTIKSSKENFYCKLCTKTYWSMLKTFVNGRKIQIITSLLVNEQVYHQHFRKSYLTNFSANNVSRYKTIYSHTENKLTDITLRMRNY